MLDIDSQRHVAARHRDEMVLDAGEIAADQREQIGRLGMRIVPDREMAAAGPASPLSTRLPFDEQHGASRLVSFDTRGVDRHYVRPVGKIGDAAETLGLALRAIGAA